MRGGREDRRLIIGRHFAADVVEKTADVSSFVSSTNECAGFLNPLSRWGEGRYKPRGRGR